MRYLLDVNVLIAGIWADHPRHAETTAWLKGKRVVLCPLAELGFIRISTNKNAMASLMEKARAGLERFVGFIKGEPISDDLLVLDSHPETSQHVTDHYLADLAAKHGCKLATFDESIDHDAVEVIVQGPQPPAVQPGN